MRVGIVGLGAMGMGAAQSCVRTGLETVGCDYLAYSSFRENAL